MNDYKKLAKEWGSKSRKEEGRMRKAALKRPTLDEMEDDDFACECDDCSGQSFVDPKGP